jgi:hypothetical protein
MCTETITKCKMVCLQCGVTSLMVVLFMLCTFKSDGTMILVKKKIYEESYVKRI